MTRPDAFQYAVDLLAGRTMADLAADPRTVLKVKCSVCGSRIGVVVNTEAGRLWVGQLNHRKRKRSRREMGVSPDGWNIIPMWVDAQHWHLLGECQCARNSVPADPIRVALATRKSTFSAAAQE